MYNKRRGAYDDGLVDVVSTSGLVVEEEEVQFFEEMEWERRSVEDDTGDKG